jgi:hypothetical protein
MKFGIPLEVKSRVLKSSFLPDATPLNVNIDRDAAAKVRGSKFPHLDKEDKFLQSGFFLTQLFRSLNFSFQMIAAPGRFKPRIFQQSHAFCIRSGYADNAVDMKGPYRNFLSDVASEWWGCNSDGNSTSIPLFVPADTQSYIRESLSDPSENVPDRYSWVPNMNCDLSFHHDLYFLIGQLIGSILYADVQAEIMWPRMTWRFLVGQEIELSDLRYFNYGFVILLERLKSLTLEEWNDDIGGYQECLDGVTRLLSSDKDVQHVASQLKVLLAKSNDRNILTGSLSSSSSSSSSLPSLSSTSSSSSSFSYGSLCDLVPPIPFSLRDELANIVFESFRKKCVCQLESIRSGLYSGD